MNEETDNRKPDAERRLAPVSLLGQQITLHPKIKDLVNTEVERCNGLPRTKRQEALQSKPATTDEVVNEILWLALRSGDISKHYTSLA